MTAPSMSAELVRCRNCGRRNRVPAAAAGTRFVWPQCPHRISPLAMASLSRADPRAGVPGSW